MSSRFFRHPSLRRGIAALALLAVALFAVQPICEAAEARLAQAAPVQVLHTPHGDGHSEGAGTCCTTLQADALVSTTAAVASHAVAATLTPSAPPAQSVAFLPPLMVADPAPPPLRPYPARSSRLLR